MNITLIGMPGVGKSTVGKALAEALGLHFVDIDKVMEEAHGKPLQDLLDEAGDEGFIALEEEAALGLQGQDGLLISPGGSIVYSPRAMEHLRSVSTVVFLNAALQDLKGRLAMEGRGVVRGRDMTLEQIFEERLPLYKRYAHVEAMMEGADTARNVARVRAVIGR